MYIGLLCSLLLITAVISVHTQQMPSVKESPGYSNKTDSRFLDYKTGFDKSNSIAPNKIFLAKLSQRKTLNFTLYNQS